MFDATPRLKKKPTPVALVVIAPPLRRQREYVKRAAAYERRRFRELTRFRQRLSQLEADDPSLVVRHADCVAYFAAQFVARPIRTVEISLRHRRWIHAHPSHAALELFRLAWNQHGPFVEWPENEPAHASWWPEAHQ